MKKLRNVFIALLGALACASFCLAFSVLIPVSAESSFKIGTTIIEEGGIYVAATDDGIDPPPSEAATVRVVDKVLSAPSTDYLVYQSGEITVYGNVTLKSKSQNIFQLTETDLTVNGGTDTSLTLVAQEACAVYCDASSNSQITLKGDLDLLINNYSKNSNAVSLQDSSILTETGYSGNITVNTLYNYEGDESNCLIEIKNGDVSLKTTGDIVFNSLSKAPAVNGEMSSSKTFLLEANNVLINGWINVPGGADVTINALNDITVKYGSQSSYMGFPLFNANNVLLTAEGDITLSNDYIVFTGQTTVKNAENLSVTFEGDGSDNPMCIGSVTVENCKNVSFLDKKGTNGSIFIGGLSATDCDNVSVVGGGNALLSINAISIKQTKNKGGNVIIRGGSKNNKLTPNSITVENYSSVQLRNNDLRGELCSSSLSVVDCDEVKLYCASDEGTSVPQISTTVNGETTYEYPLALVTYADGSEVFCDTVESARQLAKASAGSVLKVFTDSIDGFDVESGENYSVDFSDCTVNGAVTVKSGAVFGIKGGEFQTLNVEGETTLNISGGTFETLGVPATATVNLSGTASVTNELTAAAGSVLNVSGNAEINKLTDNGATIKLSGGKFGEIVTSDYASILEEEYCYYNGNSESVVLSEATSSVFYMVGKCLSHEKISGSGICKYCAAPCDHYNLGEDLVCVDCGESVVASITSNYVVKYYLSVQEALNAVTDNCTLKLLADADGFTVSSGKFTLDATNRVVNGTMIVEESAELTVIGGTFKCSAMTVAILNKGKLTLNNVNCERTFMSKKNSEIYINGGSFSRVTLYDIFYGKISSGNISALQFDDKTLNLDIIGGTFGSIYLDSDMTLKDILAEGYSFTQGSGTQRWVSSAVSGHIEGVTYNVEKLPIQSFYIDGNAEITYKDNASLTAVSVLAEGYSSVSIGWKKGDADLGNGATLDLKSLELNSGTHTFTCVAACDGYEVAANFELTVNPINIEDVAVVSVPDYFKTGETILATINVTVGGTSLVAEQDYTVSGEVSGIESGTYNMVISGTGNYSGTIEKEWKIVTPVVSSDVSGTTVQYASITQALSDGVNNIKLLCDIAVEECITVTSELIVDLNGYVLRYVKPFTSNSVFVVSNSSTLTLTDGRPNATHTDTTLPVGGVIEGGTGSGGMTRYTLGGGVYVQNGSFIMEGGSICYCSASIGGGVYVQNGLFEMKGGRIFQCSANFEASAVFVEETGSFTMRGGEISGSSSVSDDRIVVKLMGNMFADGGVVNGVVDVSDLAKIKHGDGEKNFTSFFGNVSGSGTVSGGLFYGTISSDISLGGKKVTFVNGETVWAILLLNDNETAIQPIAPEDERILTGWYNGDTPHVFSLGITQDLTLEVKWAVTQETVDRLRADMETAKNELSSAISSGDSDLSQSINTLGDKITLLEQAAAQSNVKDAELQNSIDSARQVLQSAIESLSARVSSAESEINSVKDRLSSTESELSDANDDINALKDNLNSANNQLDSAKEQLDSANEEINSVKVAFIIVSCVLGIADIALLAYVLIVKSKKF